MKKTKFFIYVFLIQFLLFCLLLFSCANDVYYPPMINVPVFTGKKQAKVNFNLRNLQGTISISDSVALFYNYANYDYYFSPYSFLANSTHAYTSKDHEVGIFYRKIHSPLYLTYTFGGGWGTFSNSYNHLNDSYYSIGSERYSEKIFSDYYKLFLQPSIGTTLDNEDIVGSVKISFLRHRLAYGYIMKEIYVDGSNLLGAKHFETTFYQEYRSKIIANSIYIEPSLTAIVRNKKENLGFFIQPRLSIPVFKLYYDYPAFDMSFDSERFILTIGVFIRVWNGIKIIDK